MPSIGFLIRQRREQLGISASKLADALGVTKQAVWNWENQPNRAPARDLLVKIASLLQLKLDELLIDTEPKATVLEQELLSLVKRLDENEQQMLLRMLRGAVGKK